MSLTGLTSGRLLVVPISMLIALASCCLGLAETTKEQAQPAAVVLSWVRNQANSDVFDFGDEPALTLEAKGKEPLANPIKLKAEWFDSENRSLVKEEKTVKALPEGEKVVFRLRREKVRGNGTYILRVAVEGNAGNAIEQQFAVIPPSKVMAGHYDWKSPYSVNYFSDWALAARIGARNVRQTFRSVKDFERFAAPARSNGLLINATLLDGPVLMKNALPSTIEKSTDAVAAIFLEIKRKYGDIVRVEEVYNEPENWPPTPKANLFIPLAKMIAGVTQKVHESKEDLKVMSTGCTHVNLSFLHQLATIGGTNAADIIAVHGYRSPCRPEFGHEENIAAIRDLLGDKPIYCDEDAYFAWTPPAPNSPAPTITVPQGSAVELDEVTQGIYLQRLYLNQIAAGFSMVNAFCGAPNHDLNSGLWHRRPGLVNYAALTHILPHPVFVKRLTKPTDSLWILEWKNDGKTVTTLWTLNSPQRLTLNFAGEGEARDTYGNAIAKGKQLELSVGGAPVFLIDSELVRFQGRAIQPSDPAPRVLLPEEKVDTPVSIRVAGSAVNMQQSRISVTVKNTSDSEIHGSLDMVFLNNAPKEWKLVPEEAAKVDLKPGQEVTLPFAPKSDDPERKPFNPYHPTAGNGYLGLYWAEGYQVSVRLALDNGQEIIRQPNVRLCLRGVPYRDNIKIDANLHDWDGVPVFEQLGEKKRNLELANFWAGQGDYYPTFRFAWCKEGLLFSAAVVDDHHDATQTGANAWRTDSIQLGFNAHLLKPDFTDYPVITLSTSGPAYLQRATAKRAAGPIPEIKLVTWRENKPTYEYSATTYYEAMIPWSVLGIQPANGVQLGFCAQFNDSDGWWRRGWEGYFTEMGGHIVDPRYFGDLTLIF